jgi:hypothetical protein
LDAAGCLAIYQRSYRLRLRRCLGEQFPATRHALGDDLFYDFADEYLRDCPSDSYTLYDLGRRFSGWLASSRPDAEQTPDGREGWIDFLIDLADYEWTLFRLFDAPGHEGRPWPEADCDDRFLALQPCLALAEYRYPVAWYFHAVRAESAVEPPRPAPSYHVILRRDFQMATFPVSAIHYRFLRGVEAKGNVAAALEDMAEWSKTPLAAVRQSWLDQVKAPWLGAGFFVRRQD